MDVKPIAQEVVQTLVLVVVEALLEFKYYLLTQVSDLEFKPFEHTL